MGDKESTQSRTKVTSAITENCYMHMDDNIRPHGEVNTMTDII